MTALWKRVSLAEAYRAREAREAERERKRELPTIYYRATAWGRWIGPWHPYREHAEDDAIRSGNGGRDEHDGRFYAGVSTAIARMEGPTIGAPRR